MLLKEIDQTPPRPLKGFTTTRQPTKIKGEKRISEKFGSQSEEGSREEILATRLLGVEVCKVPNAELKKFRHVLGLIHTWIFTHKALHTCQMPVKELLRRFNDCFGEFSKMFLNE